LLIAEETVRSKWINEGRCDAGDKGVFIFVDPFLLTVNRLPWLPRCCPKALRASERAFRSRPRNLWPCNPLLNGLAQLHSPFDSLRRQRERKKISALIIFTIRSLANKLILCSPMHDLLGLRIRGRVTGPPEVIAVLCRQRTLCGFHDIDCLNWTSVVHFSGKPFTNNLRQLSFRVGTARPVNGRSAFPDGAD
jgi:hypothetical protein